MPPSTLPLLRRLARNCHSIKCIGAARKHKGTCYRALHAATSNGQVTHTRNFHHILSKNLPDTDDRIPKRFSSNTTQPSPNLPASTDVIIVGGGIAGICTAHYLLRQSSNITVRLIDELPGVARATSRINGGLICPSLSNSWTNMPIFAGKDAIARMALRQIMGRNDGGGASLLKFDPKLMLDTRFWTFFLQWVRRKPYLGEQNEVISALMHHSMDCFNDTSDGIMQSLEYNRTAVGTKTNDGRLGEVDEVGDIGKFCSGLHDKLAEKHGDRYLFDFSTAVGTLEVANERVGSVNATQGNKPNALEADQYVIAAGNQSYSLCAELGVPCPILPCKGYIIVFHSKVEVPTNIELRNKAFVAPFGGGKYHLSGFAEFTSEYNTQKAMKIDQDRADALIKVAKEIFPDMEVESANVGYRPLSPDDTPLIGPTKYSNLFVCAGGGSKGWSQGPGSGQLLADIMLETDTKIDAAPYSPRRFELVG